MKKAVSSSNIAVNLKRRDLLAVALALPLHACGGGGGGGSDGGGGGSSSGASTIAQPVSASVSLNSSQSGAQLSSYYAGLSYEKTKLTVSMFTASNTVLVNLFKLLGPSVLRLSGNAVDKSSWNGAVVGLPVITPAQVDALAGFLAATGWQAMYGINHAQNTPADAAAEASYVAAKLGSRLLGFEIGNEPDIYPTNGLRPATYAYSDYLVEWQQMAQAVRAAVPGCTLIGPATGTDVMGYTVPFAQAAAGTISMLTQHYYRGNGLMASSTLDLLLKPDPVLAQRLDAMVGAAKSAALPMGCRMGECNSYSRGGTLNISNTYGTALWVIDFLFTLALKNCGGANLHGGGNTTGYTPIADNNGVIEGARPEFYGIKLFAEAAQGTALPTNLVLSQSINFTAYGVARTDGGSNVMLVNKDTKETARVTISLSNSVRSVSTMALSGPAIDSTSGMLLNGASVNADGSFKATYVPLQATNGQIQIDVPPITAILVKST